MMKLLALLVMALVATPPLPVNSQKAKELKDENAGKSKLSANGNSTTSHGPPACLSLNLDSVNFKNMINFSPFVLMRASMNAFNCGQTAYVGPAANSKGYTGTGIVLQQGITSSFRIQLTDKNTIFSSVLCSNGAQADYRTVYAKLRPHSLSLCVADCADDGVGYNIVYCIGRTAQDEADIDNFLQTTLSGIQMFDLQAGCPQPQYCDLFDH